MSAILRILPEVSNIPPLAIPDNIHRRNGRYNNAQTRIRKGARWFDCEDFILAQNLDIFNMTNLIIQELTLSGNTWPSSSISHNNLINQSWPDRVTSLTGDPQGTISRHPDLISVSLVWIQFPIWCGVPLPNIHGCRRNYLIPVATWLNQWEN